MPFSMKEYQKQYRPKWYAKNRKKWGEYVKGRHKAERKKIIEMLGSQCKVCGMTQNDLAKYKAKSATQKWLHCHEINGAADHIHTTSYVLKNLKDFVLLCPSCHRGVHFCRNYLGLSWTELIQLITPKR